MKIKIVEDKAQWEDFVLSRHPNIFLQSWNWGETHRLSGKKIFRLGIFEKKKLICVALVIKEEAKRGHYFTIPGGPLLRDWRPKTLSQLFQALEKKASQEKIFFVRVRPSLSNTQKNQALFSKLGFKKAPMHLHAETTLKIDLKQSLEEILSNMRKNTRYSIRKAQRQGVKTEISQRIEDIEVLYQLQMETVKRHKFIPFSLEFFKNHFKAFLPDNQIALIKASFQGETLSIGMFVFYGDTAVYHYSGSSSRYPKIPASSAMLWQAIQEAKRRGCQIFDLWGIAPTNDLHHRFAGVTLFKMGFGGEKAEYLPAQDLPTNHRYWFTRLFETGRRLKRGL